ncbi:PspA/IM30 family protein [Gorillibacterium massiliense]|uniref:PspA/IM30 family protein n=1 Tax=Gorillibacterium massiliense TaxID=1280390 RepID=UPI0004AD7FAF
MSIMKRMRDITVATLNDRLEQAEDPVQLIDGYLAGLRDKIRDAERLHGQVSVHAQSVRHQYLTAFQMKEKREEQAMLALKAGEEEIARLALEDKMQHEETCTRYGALYEDGKRSLLDLEAQLKQLKQDYDEVAAKRSYYQARMESLRLQQRMNDRLGTAPVGPSARAFQRLDDRLSDLELEAQSLRDVRRATAGFSTTMNYAAGVAQNKLEYEMERLRLKLGDKYEEKRLQLEEKLEEKRIRLEEKLDEKRQQLEEKLNEKLQKLEQLNMTETKEGWGKV